MLGRCLLLIFLLHQQRYANSARCEGTPTVNVSAHVCQSFNDTACNHSDIIFCRWDSGNGCTPKAFSSCSLLVDSSEDCNLIEGCFWAEVPVWLWLAINIPVWLVVAGVCLICYHKNIGASRLEVYARSDSMTVADSSQFTPEQESSIPDIFRVPLPGVFSKGNTESEISSNESSVHEME